DLGGSFRKLTHYHNGVEFDASFNPLQFKDVAYLKEFILSVADASWGNKDQGKLFKAIKGILESDKVSDFKEFILKLEKEIPGISLYFEEIIESLSAKQTQTGKITYCDFSRYPEKIKAPLIIFMIEYFKNLPGRKIFVFDECWHLLNKHADYITECFRTFRKYEACALAIGQNLNDFISTSVGKAIVENTHYKILFRQDLAANEYLGVGVASKLSSIHSKKGAYSESLFIFENLSKAVRYYPTPLEYELFTSDKTDNDHFQKYVSDCGRFLEFPQALENYVSIKYPSEQGQSNA
ncbi:MAG: hypothetical protein WCG27_12770, partial [Pseudomonadota bacterium]